MISRTSYWHGKRCVVTGGTGFIGSHLCARLHKMGAEVVNFDVERPGEGSLFVLLNGNREISTSSFDLAEIPSIDAVAEEEPDVIFHLAAIPYGPATSEHPTEAFRSNVMSTVNMLEAARRAGSERFVLASSACYFGATLASPLTEDSPLESPEHFYTYTKRQAEDQVQAYNEFYGVPASICRFVNIYGPGDRHFGRIIPQICRQLIVEESDVLHLYRSDGESVFEFLYVEDAVDALLAAACDVPDLLDVFHFGPGPSARLKILDLVERLSLLFDGRPRKILPNQVSSEKPVRKYLDTSRTQEMLDWAPEWDLDDGLTHTLEWYRRHLHQITPRPDTL